MTKAIFLLLASAALAASEPAHIADYDKYITYVDFIEHKDNTALRTAWGVCHTCDWPEYPIEIRKRKGLDFLFAPNLEFTINHEKAHRFECIAFDKAPERWMKFEACFEQITKKDYDEEKFANTYAKIRKRGIKTKLDYLVYNYVWHDILPE